MQGVFDVSSARARHREKECAEALHHRRKGNDLYEAGDFEGAAESYTIAIKLAPLAVLHSNRAASYMMLGWWEQALRDTRVALRKDPNNERVMERQAKCLIIMDNLGEAETVLDQVTLDNDETWSTSQERLRWLCQNAKAPVRLDIIRTALGRLHAEGGGKSPLGTRLRKAFIKALVERSDALQHERSIGPVSENLLDVEEIAEITPFAEEALLVSWELLKDDPADSEVRYWRGRALVRLGRHEDAQIQLRQGLQEHPEHQGIKDLIDTMTSLEEITAKGTEFYRGGRLREALQLFTSGIDRDQECVDVHAVSLLHHCRSTVLRRCGDFAQGLEDVNVALSLRPKWTKGLYLRGKLLLELGRPAEALTELKTVQRADPTFDEHLEDWLRRAHCWLAKPQSEKNHYAIMRLPMDSSKDEIKRQFRRLCLLWHPDKNQNENCRDRFEELQVAYQFLMDDDGRAVYDFGMWRDRRVRHHVKKREKTKHFVDSPCEFEHSQSWEEMAFIMDDKIGSVFWPDGVAPEWLQEERKRFREGTFGRSHI